MDRKINLRNESIHLYNHKKEGWSSYDINYANALRKKRDKNFISKTLKIENERYAA